MDWFQVIALSVIQGLTEFLPISSSAHLILPSQILGWPDQGLAFDVAVHVGTLLAVILYFRRDVAQLTVGWGKSMAGIKSDEGRIAWLIILGTLPAGISGLVFGDYIEENLRSGLVIATTTIIFALALWWADKSGSRTKEIAQMGWQIALVIGVSQAIALIPGTSRSGITMTAALLLGFTRESSAKFSFLLSIPLIAAAGMLKTKELMETGTDAQWVMVSAGVVMSFLSAYACIHFFLNFLERLGFFPYVIYRLLLGVCLFAILL
ncbi:MAG: undecaprenyl-diphosphate phosphatase [Hahellaceae bacterium]|nr:undecaprenyl-diphosphate phosphatase [Hahellaceae bacterium]